MHIDTDLLLTAERLQLEPGLVRGPKVRGAFTLKRVSSQTYLVVNELQSRVLEEFAQPRNVPDVLESCIRRRICPSLREFYDLIVKAHRAGILRSEELDAEGPGATARPPVHWFVPVPPKLGLILTAAGLVATLAAMIFCVPMPPKGVDIFYGWLSVCGALSLGHLLAASALHGADCEVRRPHLRWLTLTPHFAVELDDICMTHRAGRAAVLGLTLFPLAVTSTTALWLRQPWAIIPLAALFIFCCPVGDTVVRNFLLLFRRRPLLSTDGAPLFDAKLSLLAQWRIVWQRFDGRVAALQGAFGILWALAFGFIAYRITGLTLWDEIRTVHDWRLELLVPAAAIGLIAAFWLASEVQYRVIDTCTAFWRRGQQELRRWRAGKTAAPDWLALDALVSRHPLLRHLPPDAQEEFVSLLKPLRARPWSRLIKYDEPQSSVGLVFSGRATVYHRLKSGRMARLYEIREGDLFGAHKIVDPNGANIEIRTNTVFLAVTLSREDFSRLVVEKLGLAAVNRYVHNHLFLHRAAALCADWRPAAITRFAELVSTTTHSAGGKIIIQGQEVGSLHVLYEGRARTMKNRRAVGSLQPGDFFGEISLLQTSVATADVETTEETRCLVVDRIEFIRFLARNQHVALQLERLCSKRLGRPVFPLDHKSFEVL
jgi:CRP-like cAMP-binding protein